MSIRQEKLPIAALERIDDLCVELENAWRRDEPPTIESMLPRATSAGERAALLAELLVLDIDYRRRRGEEPTAQEYTDRLPGDSEAIHRALEEGEKRTGDSRFEPPTVARLAKLFPALEIIELISIRWALSSTKC